MSSATPPRSPTRTSHHQHHRSRQSRCADAPATPTPHATTTPHTTSTPELELYSHFPALRTVPHVELCTLPSPVERLDVQGTTLWIKRDDLDADECGGNKARTLEFLLPGLAPGDTVITSGGEGSTQVLAVATHAARLGARTIAIRWRHDMNDSATRVARLITERCAYAPVTTTIPGAIARTTWLRMRTGARYIPLGGTTPAGILAHVNAGLELATQVAAGALPPPARVIVPLGSGGTMAGLAIGFAAAGLDSVIIGVQVSPLLIANRGHVRRLIRRTIHLIEQTTHQRIPHPPAHLLGVVRGAYGGGYGRPLPAGIAAAQILESTCGIRTDQTYTAKALAVALSLAHEHPGATLFWNTFDGRLL